MGFDPDQTPGMGEGFIAGFCMGVSCACTLGGLVAIGMVLFAW